MPMAFPRVVLPSTLFLTCAALAIGAGTPPRPETAKAVLVVHGGAGVLLPKEMAEIKLDGGQQMVAEQFEAGLASALEAGYEAYQREGAAPQVDAVEAAIRVLEDSELFNAGRGAALDNDGQARLDASLIEGKVDSKWGTGEGKLDPRKRAGGVGGVTHIKNPISAARAIMEMSGNRAVLLVGEGAEVFALSEENRNRYHLERVSNTYFWTQRRLKGVLGSIQEDAKKAKEAAPPAKAPARDNFRGTVGAVSVKGGTIAAGTSTGGLTNKMLGRIGDSPQIGTGTFADDRACGVSCTGTGEVFIRYAVAHDVTARMLYGKATVADAALGAIDQLPDEAEGVGGLIALDKDGNAAFAMSKRSTGMYRGYVTDKGEIHVAIFQDDPLSRMVREGGKWVKRPAGR